MAEAANSSTAPNGKPADESKAGASPEPRLWVMLLKDAAVVFGALSLWAAADMWHQVTGLWLAQVVAVGDGLLVGLVLATLFHEWGHYAGAVAAKADVRRVSPKRLSFFRFRFNFDENDVKQFHWMTYGGHILHWSILIVLLIALPMDTLGRISLAGSTFGFIVFATVIEYNVVKDTWAGVDPETRLQQISSADFRQASLIGTLGGLFAIALLS